MLSLLFGKDGMLLPAMICVNAKEMILCEFNRKLKEASCHLRQTESFNPWLNVAEREIKKLEEDSCRKLIKSSAPKRH